MKFYAALLLFIVLHSSTARSQETLASGEQPQMTVDEKETVRVVFGKGAQIYYAVSGNKGRSFSKPVVIAEVDGMHLGMTRGPQLATSKDYSLVTAMDKEGNIHAFRLTHLSGKWERLPAVNDANGSAPEGLMSLAADDKNNFFAVWLDLRESRKNNICFASLKGNKGWSKNMFAYKSPEGHVCECCKPSIAVNGNHVVIMFRNWSKGSRDPYFVSSENGGKHFSQAEKLGNGTWPLKGCPMDGGGLAIDSEDQIHTAWQRQGNVFYVQPGQPEHKIGEGRSIGLSGNIVTWEAGADLIIHRINGDTRNIGQGTALQVHEFSDAPPILSDTWTPICKRRLLIFPFFSSLVMTMNSSWAIGKTERIRWLRNSPGEWQTLSENGFLMMISSTLVAH